MVTKEIPVHFSLNFAFESGGGGGGGWNSEAGIHGGEGANVSDDGAQCPVGWWLFDVSFAMPSGNHEMRSLARKVNACVFRCSDRRFLLVFLVLKSGTRWCR
jgi:hypothetical protein